jgi:hypothetical protein
LPSILSLRVAAPSGVVFFFFLPVCGTVYRRSSLISGSDRRNILILAGVNVGCYSTLLLLVSTGIDKKKKTCLD